MPPRRVSPAMKHSSSDAKPGAHKKQRRETDDITPVITRVRSALSAIEALPEDVRTMISGVLQNAAAVPKPDRHAFQAEMLDMIANALTHEEQRLEAALQATKETVTGAEAARAEAESKRDAAKADLEAKERSAQEQGKTCESARQAEKDATAALRVAQGEQEDLGQVSSALQKTSEAEWAVYNESLKDLKQAPTPEGEEAVPTLGARVAEKDVNAVLAVLERAKLDTLCSRGRPRLCRSSRRSVASSTISFGTPWRRPLRSARPK